MSIARFSKISLAGSLQDRERLLRQWQAFGRLHIINQDGSQGFERKLSAKDKRAYEAMKHLQSCPHPRRPLQRWPQALLQQNQPLLAAKKLIDDSFGNAQQLRDISDQIDALEERIRALKPWGDFNLPPNTSVDLFRLWFYRLPVTQRSVLDDFPLPWQIAGRSARFYYLIVVSAHEPNSDLLPIPREHLGSQSLHQLQLQLEALQSQYEDLQIERERLTRFRELLRRHLVAADNEALYQFVMAQTCCHGKVFTLQAWVPTASLAELDEIAASYGFAWSAEPAADDEQPPTWLQPAKGLRPGALLASIYQLPDYRSWDPSGHLYLSFVVFFAMILSDAGYSLLLLLALAIGWRKYSHTEQQRTLRQLFASLCLAALAWGILAGSYLGYDITALAPNCWLTQLQVIDLNNYDSMMRLSVFAGAAHISLAIIGVAWSRRHQWWQLLARSGWLGLLTAGLGIWQLPQYQLAWQIVAAVAATAIVFAVFWSTKIAKKSSLLSLASGVLALANVSKLFGDVLSYMRLFALGLASASLGLTFNELAANALHSSPGIGVLSATLIFVLGHAVNLMLAIMSGVVHGLRLNFIEFYNWGEPGEGVCYQPFKLKED